MSSLDYLQFSAGVRLHWSEVRQQHWLLFPEGALALNTSAVSILAQCNGKNSFRAISATLKQQFSEVQEQDIQNLLCSMMQRGLLINNLP